MQVHGTNLMVINFAIFGFIIEKSLNDQLTSWLNNAEIDIENIKIVKAIIGPYSKNIILDNLFRHAGYTYSGPTAAWAYKYLSLTREE